MGASQTSTRRELVRETSPRCRTHPQTPTAGCVHPTLAAVVFTAGLLTTRFLPGYSGPGTSALLVRRLALRTVALVADNGRVVQRKSRDFRTTLLDATSPIPGALLSVRAPVAAVIVAVANVPAQTTGPVRAPLVGAVFAAVANV